MSSKDTTLRDQLFAYLRRQTDATYATHSYTHHWLRWSWNYLHADQSRDYYSLLDWLDRHAASCQMKLRDGGYEDSDERRDLVDRLDGVRVVRMCVTEKYEQLRQALARGLEQEETALLASGAREEESHRG